MKVWIRCDGSPVIGSGHVIRMLALADALQGQGASVGFLMRPLSTALQERVQQAGFPVQPVPGSVDGFEVSAETELAVFSQCLPSDGLIVDHYGYDAALLKQACQHFDAVALVDDYQPERLIPEIHLLINPNASVGSLSYPGYPGQIQLLGPQYALLRPEFWPEHHPGYVFQPECKRVFICLGGSGRGNMMVQLLQLLSKIHRPLKLTVVIGFKNPHAAEIQHALDAMALPYMLLSSVEDMAGSLLQQDLAILPASTVTLEAMALGVPTATVICEDNQRPGGYAMAEMGATTLLGDITCWDPLQALEKLSHLIHDAAHREVVARVGLSLVNPKGACQVAKTILTLAHRASLSP